MRVVQVRKLGKYFHDFVGSLTAGSNNYDVSLRLFRNGVLHHGLARTERAGDKACTAFHNRI
ncbi:hypothetical protein Barb7_02100 [Bacteroidales bacterium Barb7]|nr:hypothetical protein Barb7_02100 [Bacteroidales bacterium Barb7]